MENKDQNNNACLQVKFEYLENPMPLDDLVLDFLIKKGTYFFVITQESRQEYNRKTWTYDTKITEYIDTVVIHENITVWGHDFFRPNKNKKLIAYCKLEFPKKITIHI